MRHFSKRFLSYSSFAISTSLILSACTTQPARTTSSINSEAGFTCGAPIIYNVKGKSQTLTNCFVQTQSGVPKEVHLLNLKGNEKDFHYAHGYLLAEEIEDGAIAEMLSVSRGLIKANPQFAWIMNAVKGCYISRMERSVSLDFLATIDAMSQGYLDGMKAKGKIPAYTRADFREGILGIDLGNIVGGLAHEAESKPVKGILNLLGACGGKIAAAAAKQVFGPKDKAPTEEEKDEAIRLLFAGYSEEHPTDDRKMGCVGVGVSAQGTSDKKLLHGRNLDQTGLLTSWSKHPVLFMMEEDNSYKYMGTGTAGLIFPAGISGMNEHGLSVTLHQMSTTRFDSLDRKGNAMIMPYLLQQTMKKAKSIDEAFAIMNKTNIFSSWTVFISDSKTNEFASIEVSANKKVMARRTKDTFMGQSNHFIARDMQKEHYHDSYNNVLETQSRLDGTEKNLKDSFGMVNLDWMIRQLSSHEDYYEGTRSFGRAPTKVSNIMSSIAIPAEGTYWMTVGDVFPAAHSQYIGVRADWKNGRMIPFATGRTSHMRSQPNYEVSLGQAVHAYQLFNKKDLPGTITHLEEARRLAALDGVKDFSYEYTLARIKHVHGDNEGAYSIMKDLTTAPRNRGLNRNHPYENAYEKALLDMWVARLGEDAKKMSHQDAVKNYESAKSVFQTVLTSSYPDHATLNLKRKIKMLNKWIKGEQTKIPHLSFSVVD
jgi:Acyl-coenzyme A:6-aminopenicillanic acid acyl-transferase